jgi:ArsR family transcriptional regulator, arsenate/arsenite/antimonite-responsive transcriptional repressor
MERFTQTMKALSDPTRLRIIHLLMHRSLCVCEMTAILNESQPKISKHMLSLYQAGLVKKTRHRQFMTYQLNQTEPLIPSVVSMIQAYQEQDYDLKVDGQVLLKPEKWACDITNRVL